METMDNGKDPKTSSGEDTESTMIRVHRNGKDLGYFDPEIACECLRFRILKPDDWAFCNGLKDWIQIGELLDVSNIVNTPTQKEGPSEGSNGSLPPRLSGATKSTQNKKPYLTAAFLAGACILILCIVSPNKDSETNSYIPTDTTFESFPSEAVSRTPSPYPVSSSGNQLQGGISAAELSGLIGASLPSGQGKEYYKREIAAGIQAYDGNYKMSPTDKRVIENMARELAR